MPKTSVILAGASPDTGNLGVNALCYSTAANLMSLNEDFDITILDHGNSYRKNGFSLADGKSCNLLGAKDSKRIYQSASYLNIQLARRVPFYNSPQKSIFKEAKAILDISGGDSFADLYGEKRYRAITFPKQLAMEYAKPLVLLPQTYGPFEQDNSRIIAQKYLRYASLAYARDAYSFDVMRDLLGDGFDDRKHQQAVDVAFILPATSVENLNAKSLLPERNASREVFGINISGLIYQNSQMARDHYKIKVDYNHLVERLVSQILTESSGDVWLIPHVLAPKGHYESDNEACQILKQKLPSELQKRVSVISGDYDQCDIKGIIGQCSWFCGTRMHATIAGLSQKIPTVGLAYSGKFKGVFASADQESSVVDARGNDSDQMFNEIMGCWARRNEVRAELEAKIPQVRERARIQMEDITKLICSK